MPRLRSSLRKELSATAVLVLSASFALSMPSAAAAAGASTTAIISTPDDGGYWLVTADSGVVPFGDAAPLGTAAGQRLNQPIVGIASTPSGKGYWLVAADGGIFPFGDAQGLGSTAGQRLNAPIVGIAAPPKGFPAAPGTSTPAQGYWLVASDGGIFPFGAGKGYGSTAGLRLNRPIVGMASTPSGAGYWLVASDGGIFPFGDAQGVGSTGGQRLNQPIVAMASTPSGKGYWLVASDGGIFPFGDAQGFGSTAGMRLNQPIIAMAPTSTGAGYWLVSGDGGVFPFGDAKSFTSSASPTVGIAGAPGDAGYWLADSGGGVFPFGSAPNLGSAAAQRLNQPIVGMASTPSGRGYWLVASNGGVLPFGDAQGYGDTAGISLNQPIIGMAGTPSGRGYWLVASDGGVFPFGDACACGNAVGRLNQPIVGIALPPKGFPALPGTAAPQQGYWLVGRDGGIFPFGAGASYGSTAGTTLSAPIVGMASTPDGGGYWLVGGDGGIFPFGNAQGHGGTAGTRLNRPIVGMAATTSGNGYWLVGGDGGIFPFGDAHAFGADPGPWTEAPPGGFPREVGAFTVGFDASAPTTGQLTDGGIAITITIPPGALPAGTRVALYRADPSIFAGQLPSGDVAIDGYAVAWSAPDGSRPAAAQPVQLDVADSPPAGAQLFKCTIRVADATGACTAPAALPAVSASGWTASFTSDPGFVLASPGSVYTSLASPQRLVDTRPTPGVSGAPQVLPPDAGGDHGLDVTVAGGGTQVPAGATAVVLNVTAVDNRATAQQPGGAGYIRVYPTGSPPTGSVANSYYPNQLTQNLVTVPVGNAGQVHAATSIPLNLVVDEEGYFAPPPAGTTSGAGQYVGLPPSRICDTRADQPGVSTNQCNNGGAGGTRGDSRPLPVQVGGVGGVPSSGVSAVVVNVTVADDNAAGYVTAFAHDGSPPATSNVNFNGVSSHFAGDPCPVAVPSGTGCQAIANRVIAPVDSAGAIDLVTVTGGSADLVVDVNGYFTSGASAQGQLFHPTQVTRLHDTRTAGDTPASAAPLHLAIAGAGSPAAVPAVATVAVVNLTIDKQSRPDQDGPGTGYLTVYPGGGNGPPNASDLDFWAGSIEAAHSFATLGGSDGSVDIYNGSPSPVEVIVDLFGYFAPA
jgi:hypothetical protein